MFVPKVSSRIRPKGRDKREKQCPGGVGGHTGDSTVWNSDPRKVAFQWMSRRENHLRIEACLLMSWIWMEKWEKYPKEPPKPKLALTWICNQEFVLSVRPENLSTGNLVGSTPSWLWVSVSGKIKVFSRLLSVLRMVTCLSTCCSLGLPRPLLSPLCPQVCLLSASLLLPGKWIHQHHLSVFHMHALIIQYLPWENLI